VINVKLVYIDNKRPVTDSLIVAETFSKRHADVMRDIRNLECSEEFNQRNFAQIDYTDESNRTYPKYLITQDGFSFLVMGYTGKEAARFKEMYINEFNLMKDQLNKPLYVLPQTMIEAMEAYLEEMKKNVLLESKIEADRSKVIFAESLQVSNDSVLIGELAKLLKQNGFDIGPIRLFQVLRKEGYLMGKGEQYNMPTQRSMELKIMEVKTGSIGKPDGTVHITRTTKITVKGQLYFINKFKSQKIAN
jgi:anti-repressor protein